ncbi:MAG: bifunctional folylpolyglutamate synthase/dihydrofolate synthase [Lewinellaceae bacterium]|nr:bifunctional folylpolyglutamate synthase/dihydrofolate synthase [Lewinellaceae bacterium]
MPSSNDQYQETLEFLYGQLPMFQRIGPAAFKKDLSNIRKLCEALGHPERKFPSLHIAGTNGKGSTAHMLAAVLQAGGRRAGLYTSPHYRDFRERIKINGRYIPKRQVVDFVERCLPLFSDIQPSFFEITVAMAFDYFARQEVDIAIIEVGLGGRLDSTNILLPELCIITNISFDHTDFLGDTLPLIAAEKAGIIKPGVPVVVGETLPETRSVFLEKAGSLQAPIIFADQHYQAIQQDASLSHTSYHVYKEGRLLYENLKLNAHGPYQYKNLQTSLQAMEWFPAPFRATEAEIRKGLYSLRDYTRLLGRWQVLSERPTILCDSAHNEAGMELAMSALRKLPYAGLHIVLGTVSDKDPRRLLRHLPSEAHYYFARPDIPRGHDAELLREKAVEMGLRGKAYSSVRNALRAARRHARPEDLIYVGGSIFVVAEVVR